MRRVQSEEDASAEAQRLLGADGSPAECHASSDDASSSLTSAAPTPPSETAACASAEDSTTASASAAGPEPAAALRLSRTSSEVGASGKGVCRICLEEDVADNLEQPCDCSGSQASAHHSCLQQWITEKGHLRCEICRGEYKGQYTVPPPRPPAHVLERERIAQLLGPHVLLTINDHDRDTRDLYDVDDDVQAQRNPIISWCFSFVLFLCFMVVLHHTLVVTTDPAAAGGASPGGGSPSGDDPRSMTPPPGAGAPGAGGHSDAANDPADYVSSLFLFLFWVLTKLLLIGIPFAIVMRIAAQQAQRERLEALYRQAAEMGRPGDAGAMHHVLALRELGFAPRGYHNRGMLTAVRDAHRPQQLHASAHRPAAAVNVGPHSPARPPATPAVEMSSRVLPAV